MQLEDPLKWLSSGAALDSRGRKGQEHDGGGWLGSWVGPRVPRPPFPGRTRGPHRVWPGHPSSWSPMMRGPRLGTGGAMSLPEQKLGSSLAWETLHRRPGTNCAPRRGQWSPECLKLWHSVPLGVRTMETLPEPLEATGLRVTCVVLSTRNPAPRAAKGPLHSGS